jgi:hypothetical protein
MDTELAKSKQRNTFSEIRKREGLKDNLQKSSKAIINGL